MRGQGKSGTPRAIRRMEIEVNNGRVPAVSSELLREFGDKEPIEVLHCYSEHYTLVEKDGAMLLGRKERNLITASAWH
ncbi:hypothetical protein T459_12061 [Capsicum annuum]|uniref:Uncharacterized protein n=1 Tax=Capsicum annuum TaxID=4072 RepID=A0A2G2ZNP7_CAPAN|nr:hypothetical protein T459_12061 [Capsicum annuum]